MLAGGGGVRTPLRDALPWDKTAFLSLCRVFTSSAYLDFKHTYSSWGFFVSFFFLLSNFSIHSNGSTLLFENCLLGNGIDVLIQLCLNSDFPLFQLYLSLQQGLDIRNGCDPVGEVDYPRKLYQHSHLHLPIATVNKTGALSLTGKIKEVIKDLIKALLRLFMTVFLVQLDS